MTNRMEMEHTRKRINGAFYKWVARRQEDLEAPSLDAAAGEPPQSAEFPQPARAAAENAAPAPSAVNEGMPASARNRASEASNPEAGRESAPPKAPTVTDWYEVLQISRNADSETIHRVYRIMAARFHPDNPKTGDVERFMLLTRAYRVLSDPDTRAEYDALYEGMGRPPIEIFELKEFVDGIDGERNRRLGILSLLYQARRRNDARPGVSVLDLERRMSLPREYLSFTLWYLRIKGYISAEENSDYAVTPAGVDYVELNSNHNVLIRQLLEAGPANAPQATQPPEFTC
jgi:curved DNA-binding protein